MLKLLALRDANWLLEVPFSLLSGTMTRALKDLLMRGFKMRVSRLKPCHEVIQAFAHASLHQVRVRIT